MQDIPFNVERMHADMIRKGWLRTDLARRAGVADMSVYRFFEGKHRTARMAMKLASALGHDLDRYLPKKAIA